MSTSAPSPPFSVTRRLTSGDVEAVRELVETVAAARGYPPVDSGRVQQALDGDAPGYIGALAWNASRTELVAYGQAVRGHDAWNIDQVVALPPGSPDPEAPDPEATAAALVQAVRGGALVEDDAPHRLWIFHADERGDRLARALGLSPVREIRQLRCRLPLDPEVRGPDLPTRPFAVGRDEHAWLEVNRRAFAWHPDQGRTTLADLQAAEQESWFDSRGFLLHERAGELVGFCWTKVHREADPPLGEIYVIGVDPGWHGQGLGRGLTVAGLDHLTRSGLTTGMLYVEATNEPAVRLYTDLGFVLHHVDRVYA